MLFSIFKKKSPLTPEEEFWSWFSENEERLYEFEQDQDKVFGDLAEEMKKVDPDLVFEFSLVLNEGKREFVISAGGIQSAFSSAEKLHAAAPDLERWMWVKFRPRRSPLMKVNIGDATIDPDEVHYLMAEDGDKVGLVLFFEDYNEPNENLFSIVAYSLLDQALGEYAVETQVGFIEFEGRDCEHFSQAFPLKELAGSFDEYWSKKD